MRTFREVLGDVCKRPAMYVGCADFALAAAYLDGYASGLRDHSPSSAQAGLAGFREWLSVRLDSCRKSGWQEIIAREDTGPDKLTALVRLYDEFDCERSVRGLDSLLEEYERVRFTPRDRVCWCEHPSDIEQVEA